jgi:proteic killer suppression protein
MIVSFKDEGTEAIFNGENTKAARKTCPESLWKIAARKLDQLDSVTTLNELRVPPGNRLEILTSNRKGQHSIRINTNIGYVLYGHPLALITLKL